MMFLAKKNSRYGNPFLAFSFIVVGLGLSHCSKDFEGEYSDPNKVEVISDRWNETDARKTAEAMIKGMVSKDWLTDYRVAHKGKKPIVIVDEVENRTDDHIDTRALTEFIRDELINSRKVRFLNKRAREKILKELKYQKSGAVAQKKALKGGRQLGAQFMLSGALSSNVQTQKGLKTVTYQTNLTLTNFESAEIEWSEKYRIKKRFKQSGSKW